MFAVKGKRQGEELQSERKKKPKLIFQPESLPPEIWLNIFSRGLDLFVLKDVCKHFHVFCNKPCFFREAVSGKNCLRRIKTVLKQSLHINQNCFQARMTNWSLRDWLKEIRIVNLGDMTITGKTVENLSFACPNIEDLTLRKVVIRKNLHHTYLFRQYCHYYQVNDLLLDRVKRLKRLRKLDLSGCSLVSTGKIVELIEKLPLEILNLSCLIKKNFQFVAVALAISPTMKRVIFHQTPSMAKYLDLIPLRVERIRDVPDDLFEQIWPHAEMMEERGG